MRWKPGFLIFLTIIVLIPIVMGANVVIHEGVCQGNETFLFGIFQKNDTHISSNPNFYNYSVCYPQSITVNLRTGNCGSGENFILGLYQQNNSHISITEEYFNYSLCSSNIICGILPSCGGTSVGSLYQADDSHWGDTNYFNQTLCCIKFPEATSVEGGGVVIDIEDEEEVEEIEEKLKIDIRKIADKIKDMGKEIIFFFAIFLFMVFIYKKKEKCYYCKKKFKVKDLLLYKNRNCCKSCYEAQKGKE